MSCTHSQFGSWGESDSESLTSILSTNEPDEGNLKQFARKTSLHGLVHVFDKRLSEVRRCFWMFAFVGCVSLFVYHSISRIGDYFEFHHNTKLDEKVASERIFPALTFCNINPLRKSALTACDIKHLRGIRRIPAEHAENITRPMYVMNRKSFKYLNETKTEVPFCGQFDWKNLYDRSAHRLWDMVKTCRFKKAHCTAEDFESVSNFLACL